MDFITATINERETAAEQALERIAKLNGTVTRYRQQIGAGNPFWVYGIEGIDIDALARNIGGRNATYVAIAIQNALHERFHSQ